MRVHQWAKNVLLFIPLITSHRVLDGHAVATVCGVFFALSVWASATYIFNDLLDIEADRAHPEKRHRPLASGRIPVRSGIGLMFGLAAFALGVSYFVSPKAPFVLLLYLGATAAYSTVFKRKLLGDVFVLAGLYCFRILAGGWITDIPISIWLLTFSYLLFLSLAFCKRASELTNIVRSGRASVSARAYGVADLDIVRMLGVGTAIGAVLEFCLYLASDAVRALYPGYELLWLLIPIALYWPSRMWIIAGRGHMNEDPVLFAIKDKMTHVLVVISAIVLVAASQPSTGFRLFLREQ